VGQRGNVWRSWPARLITALELMKPQRTWKEVLLDWAPELSVKLGRPIDEIRSKGLTADDFSPAHSVEIRDPNGAVSRFKFAFSVVRPTAKQAAVLSEHDGYLEFDLVEDSVVADITEEIYRQE
jgi:hypothetical protein